MTNPAGTHSPTGLAAVCGECTPEIAAVTIYDAPLRRLGYKIRLDSPTALIAMLTRAGARPRPMNRREPARGTWIANCPICGAEDALFVEPGGTEWLTRCGCSTGGGVFELHARLVLAAMAA